jgi:hypothetical protein
MHDDGPVPTPPTADDPEAPRRPLTPAAERALAEAAERRRLREEAEARASDPKEVGGRKGPDPVRYGDWEKDGIVSDF